MFRPINAMKLFSRKTPILAPALIFFMIAIIASTASDVHRLEINPIACGMCN